nr:PDDEXK nuclease domain-containing protein [Subtercola sp. RTI3]
MVSEIGSVPSDYPLVLEDLKSRVRAARLTAHRRVNAELIMLYWSIGNTVLQRQIDEGWGSQVVTRLAEDLRAEFPAMKGFSRSNVFYMRSFAGAWPDLDQLVQQAAGLLPWGHIMVILDKLETQSERDWYVAKAAEHAWSRNALMNQIMNRTLQRTGAAPSNFAGQLAPADSDLATQLSKDPYVFDFLDLTDEVAERDLEQALLDRIVETLREFGAGFAFVGRQVHFDVGGDDFFVDLLFFHTEQLRYVVIELKMGKFEPGYTGQLGFYIAVVDDKMRRDFTDRPAVS